MKLFRTVFTTLLSLSLLMASISAQAINKLELDGYGGLGDDIFGLPWGLRGTSTFTSDSGVFSSNNFSSASAVRINFDSFDRNTWISLSFHSGSSNTPLSVGVYENAQRWLFSDAGRPGLDYGNTGGGFNTLDGRFEIYEIQRDQAGAITNFVASFEIFSHPAPTGQPLIGGRIWYSVAAPPVTGVPEPANLAMLMAGLGLLGFVVRRRQQYQ